MAIALVRQPPLALPPHPFCIIFCLSRNAVPQTASARPPSSRQGAGIAGGQLLAGFFGEGPSWRKPFLIVASPTIALCGLVLLFVEEPKRGKKARAGRRGLFVPLGSATGSAAAEINETADKRIGDIS